MRGVLRQGSGAHQRGRQATEGSLAVRRREDSRPQRCARRRSRIHRHARTNAPPAISPTNAPRPIAPKISRRNHKVTLENLFATLDSQAGKTLKVVVKADTQGSVEAIVEALKKIEYRQGGARSHPQ
ncbi:MAG: translation initiation factor IF-2 [Verrucomicrobiota bacterium]